jgi:hypothetical protein
LRIGKQKRPVRSEGTGGGDKINGRNKREDEVWEEANKTNR